MNVFLKKFLPTDQKKKGIIQKRNSLEFIWFVMTRVGSTDQNPTDLRKSLYKTNWQTESHRMKEDLTLHLIVQLYHFGV